MPLLLFHLNLLKVSDWSGSTYQDRKYMNKYVSQFGSGSQYSYIHGEDESSFQLVDNAKVSVTLQFMLIFMLQYIKGNFALRCLICFNLVPLNEITLAIAR